MQGLGYRPKTTEPLIFRDQNMPLDVETAKIITLSTAHLHPGAQAALRAANEDLAGMPAVAVRDYGFFVNSYYDPTLLPSETPFSDYSLIHRVPDLFLIRAFAWRAGAAWINVDIDGSRRDDRLPCYDCDGTIDLPTDDCCHASCPKCGAPPALTQTQGNLSMMWSDDTNRRIF